MVCLCGVFVCVLVFVLFSCLIRVFDVLAWLLLVWFVFCGGVVCGAFVVCVFVLPLALFGLVVVCLFVFFFGGGCSVCLWCLSLRCVCVLLRVLVFGLFLFYVVRCRCWCRVCCLAVLSCMFLSVGVLLR